MRKKEAEALLSEIDKDMGPRGGGAFQEAGFCRTVGLLQSGGTNPGDGAEIYPDHYGKGRTDRDYLDGRALF